MDELKLITLTNNKGMNVEVINFGARLSSVMFPTAHGLQAMTVAYDDVKHQLTDPYYIGATCGPVCNRISQAQFVLNGHTYSLDKNDGDNTLHSGLNNISVQYWDVDSKTLTSNYVKLTLNHDDLAGGFPGKVTLVAEYTLTDDNKLDIIYSATTDKPTPINLTNHAYFNLGEKDCLDLNFNLASSAFLERSSIGIPTGNVLGTDVIGVNLRQGTSVNNLVAASGYQQIKQELGLDTCFVLDNTGYEQAKAELWSDKTGVKLQVFTNQPAVQVYSGKFLQQPFIPFQGICFECQGYVDAPNQPTFPSIMLQPNNTYRNHISYQFSNI
ncbi:galactose mutarotase [Psychrosphaera sp. F3M07]|uniref:aldose epimerase family protein n=1 Tax=Psychrosphaera sp. F3M07 TaxID=2841560 RepID=UPI001C080C41|nr:aldose epimerase family protein [Psychrosphaera sp. F3M07]MBU2918858.1 galactose mutarotase [Psychrosphaera sp. F3M07]